MTIYFSHRSQIAFLLPTTATCWKFAQFSFLVVTCQYTMGPNTDTTTFIPERGTMLLLFLSPLFLHSREEHWQPTLDLLLIALLTRQVERDRSCQSQQKLVLSTALLYRQSPLTPREPKESRTGCSIENTTLTFLAYFILSFSLTLQYLTLQHDNKAHKAVCTVVLEKTIFWYVWEKWHARQSLHVSAFNHFWWIPTVWKDRQAWQAVGSLSEREIALLLCWALPSFVCFRRQAGSRVRLASFYMLLLCLQ